MKEGLVCRHEQNIWILGLAVCIEPEALSCDRKNLHLAQMPDEHIYSIWAIRTNEKKKKSS